MPTLPQDIKDLILDFNQHARFNIVLSHLRGSLRLLLNLEKFSMPYIVARRMRIFKRVYQNPEAWDPDEFIPNINDDEKTAKRKRKYGKYHIV